MRLRDEISEARYAVGLMSGTSLDGIDAACCRIRRDPASDPPTNYEVTVESFHTEAYPADLRAELLALCDDETGTVDAVCRTNVALGELFADAALAACEEADVSPEEVAVVGSHGQTVWHAPDPEAVPGTDRHTRSTLQIGDGSVIAHRTGVPTVSDFRLGDIAAGGHGAPLTPFFDLACLSADDEARALQNIGGIGNCTLLPPSPDRDDALAFDTGPGNMVIDAVVETLTDGEATYDEDGEWAAEGGVDEKVVAEFLDDSYFERAPPKTTGRERFGHHYAREFVAAARDRDCGDADIVASATALTAQSIADAYDRFADPYPDRIVVSGGGANNPTLLSMLAERTRSPVERLESLGLDSDAKEAALFALLGITSLDGVANNVPRATGAERPVALGKLSRP
ncbi:anhydro-N-acetylmuramic acid kinase [Halorussus amylolyticus]|uniref:anhydro-N-acetylmuramic acid kinase n=1 Tax=Halorussus amylolyticus TaxID=1126242 RepID=UPI0010465AA1|nr:anhydro-N-acetylmuramic acid kinase [Halorussus amylolyticus]